MQKRDMKIKFGGKFNSNNFVQRQHLVQNNKSKDDVSEKQDKKTYFYEEKRTGQIADYGEDITIHAVLSLSTLQWCSRRGKDLALSGIQNCQFLPRFGAEYPHN